MVHDIEPISWPDGISTESCGEIQKLTGENCRSPRDLLSTIGCCRLASPCVQMALIKNVSGETIPDFDTMSLFHPVHHLGQRHQAIQQRQDVTSLANMALRHRKRGPLTSSCDNTTAIPSFLVYSTCSQCVTGRIGTSCNC